MMTLELDHKAIRSYGQTEKVPILATEIKDHTPQKRTSACVFIDHTHHLYLNPAILNLIR